MISSQNSVRLQTVTRRKYPTHIYKQLSRGINIKRNTQVWNLVPKFLKLFPLRTEIFLTSLLYPLPTFVLPLRHTNDRLTPACALTPALRQGP